MSSSDSSEEHAPAVRKEVVSEAPVLSEVSNVAGGESGSVSAISTSGVAAVSRSTPHVSEASDPVTGDNQKPIGPAPSQAESTSSISVEREQNTSKKTDREPRSAEQGTLSAATRSCGPTLCSTDEQLNLAQWDESLQTNSLGYAPGAQSFVSTPQPSSLDASIAQATVEHG